MDFQAPTALRPATSLRHAWPAVLLGIAVFWLFTGGAILAPLHLDWILNQEDPTQHYTGWNFFRHQPLWQFPFGKNTAFGETLGSSIVFTDSVPLMAFAFKPFAPWLPADFQYFGLWILLCFVLQSVFAWKVLSFFTQDRWLLAMGSCFFVLSPAMLFRLMGHEALVGHWLVLAAIYIFLRTEDGKWWRWALLVAAACLVHGYFVAMVGALWFTDFVRRIACRRMAGRAAVGELLAVIGALLLTTWMAGYFYPGSMREQGFGKYRFNLFAPFNPLNMFSAFWSSTVYTEGEIEGFAYLGTGMLALGGLAVVAWLVPGRRPRAAWSTLVPVLLSSALFLAYAVSNKVAWAGQELWSYEVPAVGQDITSVFRASGRFAWPVLYWLQFGILAGVLLRLRPRFAHAVLALCLAVQVADLSAASRYFRDRWSDPYVPELFSSFWAQTHGRYGRLAFAPVVRKPRGGAALALMASRHGMSVNSGYLARIDAERMEAVRLATERELLEGRFRADTLYIVDDDVLWVRLLPQLSPADLAADVDGHHVLAPAWCQGRGDCSVAATLAAIARDRPDITDFLPGGDAASRQRGGWGAAESLGTWTVGTDARLHIPVADTAGRLLTFEYDQLPSRALQGQRVDITVNGTLAAQWAHPSPKHVIRQIRVPAEVVARGHGVLDIALHLPDATSPSATGFNTDDRLLALYMQKIEMRRLNPDGE
ncbi:MAG: DUF6311 domain-containing protein [Pseudomonadota bacterium]